jgi:dihydroorotase
VSDLVIKGGTVVDATGSRTADVAIAAGRIVAVGDDLSGDRTLDAGGCFVTPGLVDLHAHLRQPGNEEAETVESASRAAVLGGFTAVLAMPNTTPAIDSASVVREVQTLGEASLCDIEVAGTITVGRNGEQLSPMGEMADLGVKVFTDNGQGLQDDRLMRRAMEYAGGLGVTLAQHPENESLSEGGHMHEGAMSSVLGIPGIPAEAEELMVMRDVTLCRLTGAKVHFQHLSTAGSIGIVSAAKNSGLSITAEIAPHHFTLTDRCVESYDSLYKVNPPLRTAQDVAAVRLALADSVVDAITSDHAPHEPHLKELPFDEAPCGMIGLETALALAMTELDMDIGALLALLSWQPAAIAGIEHCHGGPIAPGRPANIAVIDPAATWVVSGREMASRSSNTPYEGRELTGRVRHTIVHGEPMVIDGEAQR